MSLCDNTEHGKRCFVNCGDRCNCDAGKPPKTNITEALDSLQLLIEHNPPKYAWEEACYEKIMKALLGDK